LLRAEGFTDIRYVELTEAHLRRAEAAKSKWLADMLAHREVDFSREFAAGLARAAAEAPPI
jgi:hypothetical protein